jgi:hypothetical protein
MAGDRWLPYLARKQDVLLPEMAILKSDQQICLHEDAG